MAQATLSCCCTAIHLEAGPTQRGEKQSGGLFFRPWEIPRNPERGPQDRGLGSGSYGSPCEKGPHLRVQVGAFFFGGLDQPSSAASRSESMVSRACTPPVEVYQTLAWRMK